MSDPIKHECGIAFIRLLKPLDYYLEKYGTALYGINKLYLMMEKQHNRGQDGAGVATIKLNAAPGQKYISRYRSKETTAIQDIFKKINGKFNEIGEKNPALLKNTDWLTQNASFTGEILLGHLRYGTFGRNNISSCHPFLRQSNWMSRNLVLAGNFNLTNVKDLFGKLVELGQHPKELSDSVTILEKIGHFIDVENRRIVDGHTANGLSTREAYTRVHDELNIEWVLKEASKQWDGGYAMCGLLGHGDSFIMRDPAGIRPAYYYQDDEFVIAASERPAIQTAFNVPFESIQEIPPGAALTVSRKGKVDLLQIREAVERKSCSFERIYFSRGSDREIYRERKLLGKLLVPQILEAVENELDDTVFSYIPNTAESAFFGLIEGINEQLNQEKARDIAAIDRQLSAEEIERIISRKPRIDKVAIKDAKLRTFITEDSSRDDLVAHIYDITYGTIRAGKDNLVIIDDSIVRGTTLKNSILRILDRLGPKRIVVVSSAPQIRYPDCYGIDMAKMGDFIAFKACIALLKDRGLESLISQVYEEAKEQLHLPDEEKINVVKKLYDPFTDKDISDKIAELLRPNEISAEIKICYQTLDSLHSACPGDLGDWYFSGDYPTPGGNRVVCQSYVNYIEGSNIRAY
tara:strand:+ start:1244 stop:3145 length:1902 start_codon:yes stop_codon:yes gene_type:complete